MRREIEGHEKTEWKELEMKAVATIRLYLSDEVIYHVMDEDSSVTV